MRRERTIRARTACAKEIHPRAAAALCTLHARNVDDKKFFVLTTIKISKQRRRVSQLEYALRATGLVTKFYGYLDGQRRIVHGDLGNELRFVYA